MTVESILYMHFSTFIAFVINMFRLPDFLTGENEEKLLERLDQAILDVINNPKKAQKTARIGTLI
ncbi:MAG: hypothetical protein GQ571_07970 [Desulfobacterales bacterium]|nr:hypothetical protein [Desulfobacterales bacterium]